MIRDEALDMIEGLAPSDGVCTCVQCVELIASFLRGSGYPASAAIVEKLKAEASTT